MASKKGTASSPTGGNSSFRVVMLNAPASLKHKEASIPLKELDSTAGLTRNIAEGLAWAPVCTWYTLGNCRNGADCRYIHPKWSQVQKFGWVGIAPHCEPEVRDRILARTDMAAVALKSGADSNAPSTGASPTGAAPSAQSLPTTPVAAGTSAMKPVSVTDQLITVLRHIFEEKKEVNVLRTDVAQEWVKRYSQKDKVVRQKAIEELIERGVVRAVGVDRLALASIAGPIKAPKPTTSTRETTGAPTAAQKQAFSDRLEKYLARVDSERLPEVSSLVEDHWTRADAFMADLASTYGEPEAAAGGPAKNAWGAPPAPVRANGVDESNDLLAAAAAVPKASRPAGASGPAWGGVGKPTPCGAARRARLPRAPRWRRPRRCHNRRRPHPPLPPSPPAQTQRSRPLLPPHRPRHQENPPPPLPLRPRHQRLPRLLDTPPSRRHRPPYPRQLRHPVPPKFPWRTRADHGSLPSPTPCKPSKGRRT
jgi:hypothetical protein